MPVGRLTFECMTTVGPLDTFSVNDNGWADLDLDVLLFLNSVNGDFEVKFTHTRKKSFTGFLVGRHLEQASALARERRASINLGRSFMLFGSTATVTTGSE